jgi:hypothetical protein
MDSWRRIYCMTFTFARFESSGCLPVQAAEYPCVQLLLTTKRHLTIALWLHIRLSTSAPASLHGCGCPWRDVSMRAFGLTEDILSTYYKYNISAITYKLNVSENMMVWKFFCVLVCRTRDQNLSSPFSYSANIRFLSTFMTWRLICAAYSFCWCYDVFMGPSRSILLSLIYIK